MNQFSALAPCNYMYQLDRDGTCSYMVLMLRTDSYIGLLIDHVASSTIGILNICLFSQFITSRLSSLKPAEGFKMLHIHFLEMHDLSE